MKVCLRSTHWAIAPSREFGAGISQAPQNTAAILEHSCSSANQGSATEHHAALAAAYYTFNGYDDWFPPSIDELIALYTQRVIVGGFDTTVYTEYWSSTQTSDIYAMAQYFFDGGYKAQINKANRPRVRAVRAF